MNRVEKMSAGENEMDDAEKLARFGMMVSEEIGVDGEEYLTEKVSGKVRGSIIPTMATAVDGLASGEIGEKEIREAARFNEVMRLTNKMANRVEENAEDEKAREVAKVIGEILGREVKIKMDDGKVSEAERWRMTNALMEVAKKYENTEEFQGKMKEIGEEESLGAEILREGMGYNKGFETQAREKFWKLRMEAVKVAGGKVVAGSGELGQGNDWANYYEKRLLKLRQDIAGAAWVAMDLRRAQADVVEAAKGGVTERMVRKNKEVNHEELVAVRENLEELDAWRAWGMDVAMQKMMERYPSDFIRRIGEQQRGEKLRGWNGWRMRDGKNGRVAAEGNVAGMESNEERGGAPTVEMLTRKKGGEYVVTDEQLESILKWYNAGAMKTVVEAQREGVERLGEFVEKIERAAKAGVIPEVMAERARGLKGGRKNIFYHLADKTKMDVPGNWAGWVSRTERQAEMFLDMVTFTGDEKNKAHVYTHEFMHLLAGKDLFSGEERVEENRIFNEAMTEYLATVVDYGENAGKNFSGKTYFDERLAVRELGRTPEECIAAYAGTGREEFFKGESEEEVARKLMEGFLEVGR